MIILLFLDCGLVFDLIILLFVDIMLSCIVCYMIGGLFCRVLMFIELVVLLVFGFSCVMWFWRIMDLLEVILLFVFFCISSGFFGMSGKWCGF